MKLFFYCLKSPRATDINPIAAQCTSQTAKQNGVNVCCVVTDLVSYNLSNVILMELYSKKQDIIKTNLQDILGQASYANAVLLRHLFLL